MENHLSIFKGKNTCNAYYYEILPLKGDGQRFKTQYLFMPKTDPSSTIQKSPHSAFPDRHTNENGTAQNLRYARRRHLYEFFVLLHVI